jgi:glucose-6-phosphate isomerase
MAGFYFRYGCDTVDFKKEVHMDNLQAVASLPEESRLRIKAALEELKRTQVIERIWKDDHTVWKPEPTEISNRLGWLHCVETMRPLLGSIHKFIEAVRADGITDAVLLGMGGSSLAPEVFSRTLGTQAGFLRLHVADTTDPGALLSIQRQLHPGKVLFIVATKSGGTVETLSGFKTYYNWLADQHGKDQAGSHFIAITDPGSSLVDLANIYRFRQIFLNDPNIGGRYSALSYFGLVPAMLLGISASEILKRAEDMATLCKSDDPAKNPAAWLGITLGELAKSGRDKLTLVLSPQLASLADWIEQLVAESTGKEGRGILPVVGEQIGQAAEYGNDRVFVCIHLESDQTTPAALRDVESAGHPIIRLRLADLYDLGGQFFLWEMATVIAGESLKINPFDQPNVESAKVMARKMAAAYLETGSLPAQSMAGEVDGIAWYGEAVSGNTLAEVLRGFLQQTTPGSYVSLQAYLQATPEMTKALHALQNTIRGKTHCAATVGYGPRFLHSTGQLHKGDRGKGLFIQITADDPEDLSIPDEAGKPASSMSFGILKFSQALGDGEALRQAGRKTLRLHLKAGIEQGLQNLLAAIKDY